MFFDEQKIDKEYQELLLSIAKKQQEIFLSRFHWRDRSPVSWPPKGLFGGKDKKAIARYDANVQELEQLRAKTSAHRKKMGYPNGTFWWNVDWEELQYFLMCDLYVDQGGGVWRYEREWNIERNGDVQILLLRENGHCSDFSSHSQTTYAQESRYSTAEQSAMVEAYRKSQKERDARRMFWSDDRMVYSRRSATLYASERDYLNSAEHWMNQWEARERYARSLYTEHITQEVTVVSHSRHYECILAVGGFAIGSNGILDLIEPLNYDVCVSRGQLGDLEEQYAQKDSLVTLAAYLADENNVRVVPMQLFGKDMTAAAANFSEAMRQAEVYTCLAHKLQFVD